MIKRLQTKNCGFTLIEVVLYLAILSTMVFGIGSFVNLVSQSRVKNQTITEVDMQASLIVQNVTQVVRNANSVVSPTIGQEGDTLTILDSENNNTIFTLDGGKFIVDHGTGAINLNNDRVYVSNLLFKNLSRVGTPAIIQINFTISYNNNSGSQNYNYSKIYVASVHISK